MYTSDKQLYVAHSTNGPIHLVGKMCNRHGLIAGATGTGKTVSLQVLAETFSQAGVPCFMADMKGDLSGISQTGTMSSFIEKRCAEFGIENPQFQPCPVRFWDVFGEQGYPMRTTVSAMGPQLLARLLGLNDTQTGVLNIVFRIADDNNLLLIDIKDLRLMLDFCGKNASKLTTEYGMISTASVGAIQRAIMTLESEGAEQFFGEPAFNIQDLIETENGRGIMNVLCADKLMLKPKLYSTFLLWLITELYANLPEVGDQELPKLVFFFDEAHMLFEDTSKALVDKIEQVIRLVRSKGVGIYFVTQSPTFLDAKGAPTMVERARILFPLSQIGAITAGQRLDIMNAAPDYIKEYKNYFDRESAYEVLSEVRKVADEQKAAEEQAKADEKARIEAEKQAEKERKEAERAAKAEEKERKAAEKKKSSGLSRTIFGTLIGAVGASVARSVGNSIGKSITGGSKKSSSSSKSSSSKSKKSSSGGVGDIFGKAAKSATTTATRKITQEILKGLFK